VIAAQLLLKLETQLPSATNADPVESYAQYETVSVIDGCAPVITGENVFERL
jgi:hypothetical protein